MPEQQEPPARDVRKRRYRRVLRTILLNTGDPNRPMIGAHTLWTHVRNGDLDHRAAKNALRAAREQDAVIRWQDEDGQYRYAVDDAGLDELPNHEPPMFGPADETALRYVLDVETSRPEPDKQVIGWVNRRLAALEDGDDDG